MRNFDNILSEIFTLKHFAIASVVGSIAYSIYSRNSWVKLAVKIPIATLMGYGIGAALIQYTDWSFSLIASICSMAGAMTDYIIKGLAKMVSSLPGLFDKFMAKKLGVKIEDNTEEIKQDKE